MMDPYQVPDQPTISMANVAAQHAAGNADGAGNAVDAFTDDDSITVESLAPNERAPRGRWQFRRPETWLPQKRNTRILAGVLLAVLLAALVAVVVATRQPEIQYTKVKEGSVQLSFGTSGTLQSATYDASFLGSGQVAEVDVSVGTQVSQGQTLAKLNTTLLDDAVNAAQAAVTAAQTKLSSAQTTQAQVQAAGQEAVAAAQNALNDCASNNTSCQQQAQNQIATAQANANSANAQAQQAVDNAQADVTTAQAQLKTAQDNLSGATLTAPHSGTISAINGTVGSIVVGGNATAPVTSFMQISDLAALQLQVNVSAANAASVAAGQAIEVTAPQVTSKTIGGTVDGISPIGKKVGQSLVYPATLDLDMSSVPPNVHLLPGMSANAMIITQKAFGAIIPASAVAFAQAAGNSKDGGFLSKAQVSNALTQARQMLADAQVNGSGDTSQETLTPSYVLEYVKGKWVAVPVVLGLTDGTTYVVVSGLTVGEKIVTGEMNGPVSVPAATPTPTSNPSGQ